MSRIKVTHGQDYKTLRRKHYADLTEQVGALVKAVRALQEGNPLPPDALAVIEQVENVKRLYPKKNPA